MKKIKNKNKKFRRLETCVRLSQSPYENHRTKFSYSNGSIQWDSNPEPPLDCLAPLKSATVVLLTGPFDHSLERECCVFGYMEEVGVGVFAGDFLYGEVEIGGGAGTLWEGLSLASMFMGLLDL